MNEQGYMAQELKKLLAPMVAMFTAEVSPKSDLISLTKAYGLYGRLWVDNHLDQGNLSVVHVGNKRCVSKSEVSLLLAVDKEPPAILLDHETNRKH